MKKLIAFTLVLMTMLGLAACGETKQPAIIYPNVNGGNVETAPSLPTQPEETLPPAEPTEEDFAALEEYVSIERTLSSGYNPGVYAGDVYLTGQEAYAYCYERLCQLSAVDKWADSEYVSRYDIEDRKVNWNREELIRNFTLVEDKWLSYSATTTDHMGNVKDMGVQFDGVTYYADGKLATLTGEAGLPGVRYWDSSAPYTSGEIGYREYDESGKLSKITYYSGEDVYLVRSFTYDESGKVTVETAKDNSNEREYLYTYDEQGRLACITWRHGFWSTSTNLTSTVSYTYAEDGRILRAERKTTDTLNTGATVTEYINIQEYLYDEQGTLIGGNFIQQEWSYTSSGYGKNKTYTEYIDYETKDTFTYTLDEQGRVVEAVKIPGAKIYRPGTDKEKVNTKPSYAEIHYTVKYGTYYVYQANEQ